MTMHTSGARFIDSPVVLPPLSDHQREHWQTYWKRIGSPVMHPDRDHYVIVRAVGDREVYLIA